MAGLRLINNNYVAHGDGRDLLVFYDAGFRGGRLAQDGVQTHMPKPRAGSPKIFRSSKRGYGARVEADTQHLNCSKSSSTFLKESKERLSLAPLARRPISEERLPDLLRTRSDPGLDGTIGFRRSVGLAANNMLTDPLKYGRAGTPLGTEVFPTGPVESADGMRVSKAPWVNNMPRNAYLGFARTPYGGYWPMGCV